MVHRAYSINVFLDYLLTQLPILSYVGSKKLGAGSRELGAGSRKAGSRELRAGTLSWELGVGNRKHY